MKCYKHKLTNILPLLAAVTLPVALGACSSSDSAVPPAPTPTLTLPVATLAGDVSNNEGDSGTRTITFTVQLDKTADGPVTVNYATADGTATAGTDYVAASGSTVISPAQTSKTIDVTINGDLKFEPDETLTLSITSVSTNVTLGTASSATGTISNDDSAPFVLFLADPDILSVNELFKYSVETGATVKVNTALLAGRSVSSFAISPNHQWIAYIANQETTGEFNLYIRDAALANPPVKITTAGPAGDGVSNLASDKPVWAPDSSRVAFRHDLNTNDVFELSTTTPGGNDRLVSRILDNTRDVQAGSFSWSSDSSKVAYLADQDGTGIIELFTNDAADDTGASNNKINGLLVDNTRAVTEYDWSPDGTRIAYRADQGATDDQFSLYTSTPTGGGNTEIADLNGIPGATMNANAFAWAPDNSRLAFIADRVGSNAVFSIHSAPGDGSATPVQIDNGVGNAYDVEGTPSWAPDSSRVAYVADISSNSIFELYTSLPATQGSTKINGTLLTGNVETSSGAHTAPPAWSPAANTLIYVAEQDAGGVKEVYVAAGDGSGSGTGNTKVSGTPMLGDASLSGDKDSWSPDGTQILYRADQDLAGTLSLWTSTSSGTNNTKLTRATPAVTTALKSFGRWSHESSYVAYASEQDNAGITELFIATPAGSITKVSGTLVNGRNVDPNTFEWAP